MAAENIYTIFFPGLTMVTFAELNTLKKGPNASCGGSLVYVLIFALLLFATDIMLVLTSISGAVLIIVSEVLKHKKNKSDENGQQ